MEHQRNNQGITGNPFDDMLDLMFEQWFTKYKKENSANAEDFRGPLHRAFREGWLSAEGFYETP